MKVSMSDISAFLACRRQWEWGSVYNLGVIGAPSNSALNIGTGVHYALEHWYRGDTDVPLNGLFLRWLVEESEKEEGTGAVLTDDDVALALTMLNGYMDKYGDAPRYDPDIRQVLTTEQEFRVAIPDTDHELIGTLDGIVESERGDLWIIDHKTYSNAPRVDSLGLNQQFLGYTWAVQSLIKAGALSGRFGFDRSSVVRGVLYNGLRKQKPSPSVRAPLFMREWVYHSADELDIFEEHLRMVLADMTRDDVLVYAAPGQHCDWCAFRSPCVARQLGEDWRWTLSNLYQQKPARGIVYEKELRALSE